MDTTTTAPPTTITLPAPLVARLAEYLVLAEYSSRRYASYGDRSRARREAEVNRLGNALVAPRTGNRYAFADLRGIDVEVPLIAPDYTLPTVTADALQAAYDRVLAPKVARLIRNRRPVPTREYEAAVRAYGDVLSMIVRGGTPMNATPRVVAMPA